MSTADIILGAIKMNISKAVLAMTYSKKKRLTEKEFEYVLKYHPGMMHEVFRILLDTHSETSFRDNGWRRKL